MANPTAEKPAGASAPPPKPAKPGIGDALLKILTSPDDTDETKQIARRRRFVMASVLGFLGVNFVMFLRFFLPRALFEPRTNTASGWYGTRRVSLSFRPSARTWDARRTGSRARTSSSAPATAAATIP